MFLENSCYQDGSLESLLFINNPTCDIDAFIISEQCPQECSLINDLDLRNSVPPYQYNSIIQDALERLLFAYDYKWNAFDLKDMRESHKENSLIMHYIESNIWHDIASNLFSAFYYSLIFYVSPLYSSSLIAFKILDYYQSFDSFCSEEDKILGYTICDIFEEVLYSNVLYFSGVGISKIRKEHFSSISKTFKNIERTFRKTDLSSQRIKKGFSEVSDLENYLPNLSFVVSSTLTEDVLGVGIKSFVPEGVQKITELFISKVVGQFSKELTKYYLYEDSMDFMDMSKKVFMLTSCGTILPNFKQDFTQNHLYGHCLGNAAYVFSKVQQSAKDAEIL